MPVSAKANKPKAAFFIFEEWHELRPSVSLGILQRRYSLKGGARSMSLVRHVTSLTYFSPGS